MLTNFVETDKESQPLFLDENNPGPESDAQNQPGTTDQSDLYYFLPQPERLDTHTIDLCEPARSYVDNASDVFMEAYPPEQIIQFGITLYLGDNGDWSFDYNQYMPSEIRSWRLPDEFIHLSYIGNTHTNHVEGLCFHAPYDKPVVAGIGVGAPVSQVVNTLGTPQFNNSKYHILGYKGTEYYFCFQGDETVERIYFQRRPDIPEERDPELQRALLLSNKPFQYDIASESDYDEMISYWEKTHYSDFGISGKAEIIDNASLYPVFSSDYPLIDVAKDYAGRVPKNGDISISPWDESEQQLYLHIIWNDYLDTVEQEGGSLLSPDGKRTLIVSPGHWGNVIVHDMEHLHSDVKISCGRIKTIEWLNDRYIIGTKHPPNLELFVLDSELAKCVFSGTNTVTDATYDLKKQLIFPDDGLWHYSFTPEGTIKFDVTHYLPRSFMTICDADFTILSKQCPPQDKRLYFEIPPCDQPCTCAE